MYLDKLEILKKLREFSKVKTALLPRDIDFCINDKVLKIFVHYPSQNMQTNNASFEAWAIALKYWLKDEIEQVELDFQLREGHEFGNVRSEGGHYNRFLYRLFSMTRFFQDWFSVCIDKKDQISKFMDWARVSSLLINASDIERDSRIISQNKERQVESWFVYHEGRELLLRRWAIESRKLFNQLPVGVFVNEVKRQNAVFTHGASAIDIWGIGEDHQTFHLIELKAGRNYSLGVISETLFYGALVYDTYLSREPLFCLNEVSKEKARSDYLAIQEARKALQYLRLHILAEHFHPLFSEGLVALINSGLNPFGIDLDCVLYSYFERKLVD